MNRKALIPLCVSLSVASLTLIGGSLYFKGHFLPSTYINNINCSLMTVNDALYAMDVSDSGPAITIVSKDGKTETIKGSQFGCTSNARDVLQDKLQNQGFWLSGVMGLNQSSDSTLDFDIDFDEGQLAECISELDCVIDGTIEPTNASIEKSVDGYYIQEGCIGNMVDKEKLCSSVVRNLKKGIFTTNILESDCYKMPNITKDSPQLSKALEKIKLIENVEITYDFKDRKEVLDKNTILNWISLDENGNVIIDNNAVSLYVDQLAYKYDTYLTDRIFHTTNRGDITVGGGIYGWQIYKSKETEALSELILSGTRTTRTPIYYIEGYERGEDDIGSTYIEIDLSIQHLWFYKNGTLFLESDIVSGYPYNGHSTPTGVFCVWSRERDRQLVGETYDTHVDYWMPINWDGVGLHDAWWQTAFGGTIYQTAYGSHGCINLPTDIAAQIYQNVEVGTPVVVYQ